MKNQFCEVTCDLYILQALDQFCDTMYNPYILLQALDQFCDAMYDLYILLQASDQFCDAMYDLYILLQASNQFCGAMYNLYILLQALDQFRDAMYDLYMAPRLPDPAWLSMMSNISYRYALCQRFVNEFVGLAAKYDNKSTKL